MLLGRKVDVVKESEVTWSCNLRATWSPSKKLGGGENEHVLTCNSQSEVTGEVCDTMGLVTF